MPAIADPPPPVLTIRIGERPAFCTEEHTAFLDALHKAKRNMFGAAPALQKQFNLNKWDALLVLAHWIRML
jgi:hypothetical protein